MRNLRLKLGESDLTEREKQLVELVFELQLMTIDMVMAAATAGRGGASETEDEKTERQQLMASRLVPIIARLLPGSAPELEPRR